jgi:outer membrane protein
MIKALRNVIVWTLVIAMGAIMGVSAQQAAPAPQGPTAPAAPLPGIGAQQAPTIDRYVVGQAKPPVLPGTQMQDLTLEQAIQLALDKNIDLKVARINPLIQDYNLVSARAVFKPVLTGSFNENRSSSVSTNVLDGVSSASSIVRGTETYNAAVAQTLPWYGSTMGISFGSSRGTTNSTFETRNPSYQGSIRVNGSLPLLANFKIDNQRNALRTQVVQRQVTDLQLTSTIENTKSQVRTGYWNLKATIEAIEIQRRALDLAKRSLVDSQTRVEIGTLAPIDTTQFETQVANAEQGLLAAEIAWRTQELAFKRLLVSGPDDDLYKMTLNPMDTPGYTQQNPDIPAAVQTAIANRTDIDVARKNLQINQLNLEVSKNNTLPGLNMTGSYQLAGQGGPLYDVNRITGARTLLADGGYFDAISGIASFDTPTWVLGFNFTYPLGMASAKAALARAELTYQQAQTNLKSTELAISTQVTQAGLNVQNTYLQFLASRKTREAREKNADAVQTRFDVGMATNFEVVTAQQDLTSSRLNELQAILRYINAVAEFDRVQKVGGS